MKPAKSPAPPAKPNPPKKPKGKGSIRPSEQRRIAAQNGSGAISADHIDIKIGTEVFVESVNGGKKCLFARRVAGTSASGKMVVFSEVQDQPEDAPAADVFVNLMIAWSQTGIRRVES